jgi:serine protease inhibitor
MTSKFFLQLTDKNKTAETDKPLSLCTYADTGKDHKEQFWRQCLKCHGFNQGACLTCCAVCHSGPGHELGPLKHDKFYCDCPESGKCKACFQKPTTSFSNEGHMPPIMCDVAMDSEDNVTPSAPKPILSSNINMGINTCATKFFETMEQSKVFSPLSVGVAMGLVHLGARTVTEDELTRFFGMKYTLEDLIKLHTYFNGNTTKMTNVLFVNKLLPLISPEYIQQIQPVALCRSEDFSKSKEICDIINNHITANTNGLIKDVMNPSMVTPNVAAFLVNTVYFKCMWTEPFEKELTEPKAKFTSDLDGSANLTVPMMNRTDKFRYYSSFNYHMVEIPYKGDDFVMGIVLIKGFAFGSNHNIRHSALQNLHENIQNLRPTLIQLSLPKFTQRKNVGLVSEFQKHGVITLFDKKAADLSGISLSVYISSIIHEAVVIVDEEGTEAAAVTVMTFSAKSCHRPKPETPVIFRCDKSFLYYIRHVESGTLLFVGDYHGN